MQSFVFCSPTEIVFGRGAEMSVAEEVRKFGGTRVLIVYGGGSVVENGVLGRIETQLESKGLKFEKFGGVVPNPRLSHAREGVTHAVDFNADFVLGVGGGSVIDTAKGIAHGVANPQTDIWDFWSGNAVVAKSIPVGAVLTIPAAGSESSDSAVLTNDKTGQKRGLSTDFNRPKFAIMNPELAYTLPRYQVACGVVDTMMHTMDRYFTPSVGNELTDELAEALLRVTVKNGTVVVNDTANYDAMSELMWCSSVSHNGLTGLGAIKDFATHKLGHELSGKFDVAHGASLSAVWRSWATYVYKERPERFARLGRKLWNIQVSDQDEAALMTIDATSDYFRSLGMPTCFSELGIGVQNPKVLEELSDSCTDCGRKTVANFKKLGRDDVYRIYELANH